MIEPEVHNRRFLGISVNWVAEIDSADRVAELISRACYSVTFGRPGPVALALSESTLLTCGTGTTKKHSIGHTYGQANA